MKLFRNTKFEVKMVDDKPANDWEGVLHAQSPGVSFTMSPEQISTAATDFITKNTETIVTGVVTVMVVKASCDIARTAARFLFR